MMVSNNEEKYFSRVCIKARSVEISLLAAVYKCSISKSRLKDVQHNNLSVTIPIRQSLPWRFRGNQVNIYQ